MTDKLTQVKQVELLNQWREEIDTCISRLQAASGNAQRAVQKWQDFVAIATQDDAIATGQAVAIELLGREAGSLASLSVLCATFAAATGQTNQQLLDKLSAAIGT